MRIIIVLAGLLAVSCGGKTIPVEIIREYTDARALYVKGDLPGALDRFLDIKRKAPRFESNLFMVGKTRFFLRETDAAIAEWKKLLAINPYHVDALRWQAEAYLVKRDPASAEALVESALAFDSENPELLLLAGKVKKAKKEFDVALEFYKKAMLFRERLAEAYIDSYEIYHQFGLTEQSNDMLDRATRLLDPESPLGKAVRLLEERKNK